MLEKSHTAGMLWKRSRAAGMNIGGAGIENRKGPEWWRTTKII